MRFFKPIYYYTPNSMYCGQMNDNCQYALKFIMHYLSIANRFDPSVGYKDLKRVMTQGGGTSIRATAKNSAAHAITVHEYLQMKKSQIGLCQA